MRILFKELISAISNSDLPEESKIDLMHRVATFRMITNGLYLKEVEHGVFECWYRNVDEEGTTYHGPTNYGIEEVISGYARANNIKRFGR